MSLQYLRVFRHIDEIARCGSIRKAAEALFLTPSALDRRLQDLEAELGTPLFERHARGMRLTSAGEIFLHHVRAQRADFERVRAEIEQLKGLQRGSVSVVASQALVHTVLPQVIQQFNERHPGITFTVTVADHAVVIQALREFQADLGIVYHAPAAADVLPLFTVDQALCAVMAEGHPLAAQPGVSMADCLAYPAALPDRSLGGRIVLDQFFARSSLKPKVAMESNSFEMLRNYVRGTTAVTFQIPLGAPMAEARDGVVARPITDRKLERSTLVVAQLKGRPLPGPAARFVEALREVLVRQ
ncbi:LysR family transcriptional regulator [Pigmentiphaga litoralis]|uniref:DNA-binding transcriptional LysR family regulator n=1 Tax=Pigmentiphaga litoralis TaxID=516702 RepID=A0A7Y9LLI5_9BURK|nr:LysR family transcriptional regulator [Pigmentiphaga litoralis]NYE23779.1 DNA-binding transcriptional LysR family regulator [Pigmentiphaga litoralis]NYE82607.1 DNA-binding transcriptional LysR family regulator [Pigmentiphaga litoralis]